MDKYQRYNQGNFQKYFGAKLLNQIDNVVIIQNKVWYQLTYCLFRRGTVVYQKQHTNFNLSILYFSGAYEHYFYQNKRKFRLFHAFSFIIVQ